MRLVYHLYSLLILSIIILFVGFSLIYAGGDNEGVLVTIGTHKITTKELEDRIEKLPPNYKDLFQTDDGKDAFLKELVRIEVFSREARTVGLHKEKGFQRRLAEIEKALLASEYSKKMILSNVVVSDDEARRYYEYHLSEFKEPEKIKAHHIFIKVPKDAQPYVLREKEEMAKEVLERLKRGEELSELLKDVSDDVSISKDEDYFARGRLVPEIEEVIFNLNIGEVSPLMRVEDGFLIFKLIDRMPERQIPYEEVKQEIVSKLRTEKQEKSFKAEEARLFSKYRVEFKKDSNSNSKTDMNGRIINIIPLDIIKEGAIGMIVVEGEGRGFDKASIKITKDTKVFTDDGRHKRPTNFSELMIGQDVEVSFVGPVFQSYPVQAEAREVIIIKKTKKQRM
ncbi:MAG: hypothetical protein Fur0020_14080 [Thermodesulfovibrionia bacterium]